MEMIKMIWHVCVRACVCLLACLHGSGCIIYFSVVSKLLILNAYYCVIVTVGGA